MFNNLRIIAQGKIGSFYLDIIDKIATCGNQAADYLCDQELIIAEAEPQLRTIRWVAEDCTQQVHRWQLPYLQFLFFGGKLGLAASKAPYTHGHPFYLPPLPNVYEDGLVCQGLTRNFESALVMFYSSRFTSPMLWDHPIRFKRAASPKHFPYEKMPDIKFADKWQEWSLSDDPLQMYDFNWEEMGRLERYQRGGWPPTLSSLGSIDEFIMRVAQDIQLFGLWKEEKREQYYALNVS